MIKLIAAHRPVTLRMVALRIVLAAFLIGGSCVIATAATDQHGIIIIKSDEFDWGADPKQTKTIVLHGNPSAEGLYIIRIRFPAGTMSRPHFHNQDRFVTVIQGTWYVGTQATFDPDNTVPVKAGGFVKHPAGAVHFDGAKDEAVIVEIRGMGPVTTTPVEKAAK